MKRRRRWIQQAVHHKGALHRMMNVPQSETIPVSTLKSWASISKWVAKRRRPFHGHGVAWWKKAGQRVRFALNVRNLRHRRRRR